MKTKSMHKICKNMQILIKTSQNAMIFLFLHKEGKLLRMRMPNLLKYIFLHNPGLGQNQFTQENCQNWAKLLKITKKIPHTVDTNSPDRCG